MKTVSIPVLAASAAMLLSACGRQPAGIEADALAAGAVPSPAAAANRGSALPGMVTTGRDFEDVPAGMETPAGARPGIACVAGIAVHAL